MAIRWFKSNVKSLIILVSLVIALYGPFLGNDFLSDDIADIKNNPHVKEFTYIAERPFGFVRPIFYFLAANIGGINPASFRIFNLLIHIGSVITLFALSKLLYGHRVAFAVSTLFAVHPVLTEPVSWISGGAYPQYTLFYLISMLFYILSQHKNDKKLYLISIASFFLSLESQQIAMTLPAVLITYEIALGSIKKNWIKIIPFILLSLIWVYVSLVAIPERVTTLQTVHYQENSQENPFKLIPIAVSEYLKLIYYPQDLTLYHSELNFSTLQFSWRVIITLAFIAFLGYCYLKNRHIFFWLSLFLISISPTVVTAILKLTWIVAERYIYLASIGIIIPTILIFKKFLEHKKYQAIAISVLVAIVLLLSIRTIVRNIDWINEDNLWIATGKTSPSSPNTHNNLGDMYGRHKNYSLAIKEFETAILLKPDYADAYHNLGNTYNEMGEKGKAIELYKKAAELNPILWQSHQNIAALYFEQQKYEEAIEQLQKAILISPNNLNLHMNLGIVYLKQGDKEKAKQIFSQILQAVPNYQPAQIGLTEAQK